MCGIVGYIGKKSALPILLDGIKNLEYRGYDSAGLAILDSSKKTNPIVEKKAVGKVSRLEEKLGNQTIDGTLGIIHSRWATHGGVTELNAHPHHDCKKNIWLVHNGIIENYKELKEHLSARDHRFYSQTDSEVLAHVIEEELSKHRSFEIAVCRALKRVRGTYGLAILYKKEPDMLIAARNFSPLLLGIGNGEYFIASDASALLRHTKQVIYLDDGEIAVLKRNEHNIYDLSQNIQKKELHEIEWTLEQAQKGGFAHFMQKEMNEEPQAIENSLRGRLLVEQGNARLGGLEPVKNKLRDINRIIISACGTAYYAGLVGEYMIEEYAGIPVEVELASEFRYRKPLIDRQTAFLVISQSGETADTLGALREAKEKGALTLGIVNVVGSTIARETHAGVYNHIGPEIGVASTKAFTSQVTILALYTLLLGRQRDLSLVMGERIARELKKIPGYIKQIIEKTDEVKKIALKYQRYKNMFFLGRKYNLPVAYEGALKLKEIAYVNAQGYGAGELKHGPIALIDDSFPSVAIVPKDSVYEKMISNIQEIKARKGKVIAIATQGDTEIQTLADDVIYIPKTLEMFTPLLSVIPLQFFAYYIGTLNGHDVDKPRNLAKSVTVE